MRISVSGELKVYSDWITIDELEDFKSEVEKVFQNSIGNLNGDYKHSVRYQDLDHENFVQEDSLIIKFLFIATVSFY